MPTGHAKLSHEVWTEIAPELKPGDFRHPEKMHVGFLRLLSKMRRECGVPFRIVSDWRSPGENPGATKSAHLEDPCRAVDLRVLTSRERYLIVSTALNHGINRVGVYAPTSWQAEEFGKASGSVHLDASPSNDKNVMWQSWTN